MHPFVAVQVMMRRTIAFARQFSCDLEEHRTADFGIISSSEADNPTLSLEVRGGAPGAQVCKEVRDERSRACRVQRRLVW